MTDSVLIVGAGPTGLALALALNRAGVTPKIVDKKASPSEESRALAIHARTLECLGRDVSMKLLTKGRKIRKAIIADDEPVAEISLEGAKTAYPFALGLSQSETERVMIAELSKRGVEVSWATSLDNLIRTDEQCVATFSNQNSETFDWVVGCDGVRSATREFAEIELESNKDSRWWQLGDVTLEGEVPDPDCMAVWLTDRGPVALIPLERAGVWRIIAVGDTNEERPETTLENLNEILQARATSAIIATESFWTSSFRIREHVAKTYRRGRILIAGDAAHAHSPLGGQGMNTGIQDAVNLGWKLALVARGMSDATLLDSYEEERRPIGARLVNATSAGTRAMYVSESWLVWLRNKFMKHLTDLDLVNSRIRDNIEMLTVAYPKSSIVDGSKLEGVNEQPDTESKRAFSSSMGPGERAALEIPQILELNDSAKHVVLLFDGREDSEEGYARMSATLTRLNASAEFETYAVVPQSAISRFESQCVIDADGEIHEAFGVKTESMVVIRPDGHIGFRSQPIDEDGLRAWWADLTGRSA